LNFGSRLRDSEFRAEKEIRRGSVCNVNEYSKSERKTLRQLAEEVYEWELHAELEPLDKAFSEWRRGEMFSSELSDKIHDFHQHAARELWSMYQSLKEDHIVARGIVLGAISETRLSSALLEKLSALIRDFRHS